MLVTAADSDYLMKETRSLVKSCARFMPEEAFLLYLVNVPYEWDERLKKWHPHLHLYHADVQESEEAVIKKMYSIRSAPMRLAMRMGDPAIIFLDGDMVLRGSLQPVLKRLHTIDLTIQYRPHLKMPGPGGDMGSAVFNSGFIGVRCSEVGCRYVERYHEQIEAHLAAGKPGRIFVPDAKVYSYIEQEFLYTTWKELEHELLFEPLDVRYNDAHFCPDSVVWHGKGTARAHPLYKRAKARYEGAMKNIFWSTYCVLRKIIKKGN